MSELEPTQVDTRPPQHRGRASARVSPEPTPLPADADGRVEMVVLRPPADVLEPAEPAAPAPPRLPGGVLSLLVARDGWIAVAILGVLLSAVFVIGLWFTR